MKFPTATKCVLMLGLAGGLTGFASAADCESIGKTVREAVAEKPAKVLVIVDEMVSKHEECSCEIVKAAISAADADKQLVREIVVTAVSASEGMAATIAECAVAEAPEAASEIKAGLSEVFAGAKSGGKSVVYDDSYSAKGGKEVIVEEDVEEDFGPEPIVISGVYLIAPSASAAGDVLRDSNGNILTQDDIDDAERLIEMLRREARRDRDGDGSTTTVSPPTPSEPK